MKMLGTPHCMLSWENLAEAKIEVLQWPWPLWKERNLWYGSCWYSILTSIYIRFSNHHVVYNRFVWFLACFGRERRPTLAQPKASSKEILVIPLSPAACAPVDQEANWCAKPWHGTAGTNCIFQDLPSLLDTIWL